VIARTSRGARALQEFVWLSKENGPRVSNAKCTEVRCRSKSEIHATQH
jgi:hypothetical protein